MPPQLQSARGPFVSEHPHPKFEIREANFGDGQGCPTPDDPALQRNTVQPKWRPLLREQMRAIDAFFYREERHAAIYVKPHGRRTT